jgi:formylglycine-generating enzyme
MRTSFLVMISAFLWLGGAGTAMGKPAVDSFRDCPNCPEMAWVPGSSFTMGASVEDELRQGMPAAQTGRSVPLHKVTFAHRFAMAKYPVTVAQFKAFVEESGYQTSDSCFTQHELDGHSIYEKVRGYTWRAPGYPQDDRHPVVCVSWEDGMAYTAWLSKKTGHQYSLPNEAQYEYAARAGTTTSYFWGDVRDEKACLYSNQPDLDQARALPGIPSGPEYRFQCSDGYAYTSPVGTYRPNPFGLYDMFGNIWEYTADCWNDNYQGAPADGSTWMMGDCDAHPSRGGSFGNAVFSTYAGVRVVRDADYHGHSWGFRVARND